MEFYFFSLFYHFINSCEKYLLDLCILLQSSMKLVKLYSHSFLIYFLFHKMDCSFYWCHHYYLNINVLFNIFVDWILKFRDLLHAFFQPSLDFFRGEEKHLYIIELYHSIQNSLEFSVFWNPYPIEASKEPFNESTLFSFYLSNLQCCLHLTQPMHLKLTNIHLCLQGFSKEHSQFRFCFLLPLYPIFKVYFSFFSINL